MSLNNKNDTVLVASGDDLTLDTIRPVSKPSLSHEWSQRFSLFDDAHFDPSRVVKTDLAASHRIEAFYLDNILTQHECDAWIALAEESGQLQSWDPSCRRFDFRRTDTIEFVSEKVARQLYARIQPHFPKSLVIDEDGTPHLHMKELEGEWTCDNTNDNLLVARYLPGDFFSPHTDGYSTISFDYRSQYSIVIYLNTCEAGGGTRFYTEDQKYALKKDACGRFTGQSNRVITTCDAKQGRCLIFSHNIVHEGVAIDQGSQKYIIRSDVMFARTRPVCDTDADHQAYALYQTATDEPDPARAIQLFKRVAKMSPKLASILGL